MCEGTHRRTPPRRSIRHVIFGAFKTVTDPAKLVAETPAKSGQVADTSNEAKALVHSLLSDAQQAAAELLWAMPPKRHFANLIDQRRSNKTDPMMRCR